MFISWKMKSAIASSVAFSGANGGAQDQAFVNSTNCRVDEGMEGCKHLFPLNMLSRVAIVTVSRCRNYPEMLTQVWENHPQLGL